MAKKIPPIKPLPNGEVPKYNVSGTTPEQEEKIREALSDMALDKYPDAIAFIPSKKYRQVADGIERTGTLGGAPVGPGANAQESFGQFGKTHIGDAFSIRSIGKTYLDDSLLKDPEKLKGILAHEMGHIASNDASEDAAEHYRKDVYQPREKAQEQLVREAGAYPPQRVMGTGLPTVEPTLSPVQQYLGSATDPQTSETAENADPRLVKVPKQ